MASITKRKKGFRVRISYKNRFDKQKLFSRQGFRTKREATLFASKVENDIANGNFPDDQNASHVFADYFQNWYKDFKEAKLSDRTKLRYILTQKEIANYFHDTKIEDITRRGYQKFINEYGSNHAKDTVHKVNSLVHACVKNAIYEDIIKKDFCEDIELIYDKSRTRKIEYLNIKETKQLIKYLDQRLNDYFTSNQMILTAIYTGARLGEIQGLRWEDINLDFQTISINHAWNEQLKTAIPTKNSSSNRIIRINSALVDMFKSMEHRGEYVFENQYQTIPTSNAVNKTLRKCLKTLKINRSGFHFHSLRHTHVAYLLSRGVDIYAISKRLGHSDIGTTIRVYSYIIDEYKERSNSDIENYLDDLAPRKAPRKVKIL